ncbi:MAG TPA: flagellar basal body rod protein FlgC [Clostridia bacterium]|nr:flagellar basal body rod protein FlgC [Clostridia bacterium]
MGLFDALSVSGSGLSAERLRLDLISDNIANANSTRSSDGTLYRRKTAVFAPRAQGRLFGSFWGILNYFRARNGDTTRVDSLGGPLGGVGAPGGVGGVRVLNIVEDPSPPKRKYDPGHPDAGPDGYVELPNVDVIKELVEMISATRAYEANVTAINAYKHMATRAMDMGRS